MLEASLLDFLAVLLFGEVVAAFAGDASEIVIALALFDAAVEVLKGEGLVAFGTGVI